MANREDEKRENTGLTNEEIKVLRDMSSIRDKNDEPSHGRLADFKEQENTNQSVAEPPLLVGGQLKVAGKAIYTHQDLIDALVMLSANQHVFELYYPDDPRIPAKQHLHEPKELDDLQEYEDRNAVEARIARDPEFWGDDMRPLDDDDMDRPPTEDARTLRELEDAILMEDREEEELEEHLDAWVMEVERGDEWMNQQNRDLER